MEFHKILIAICDEPGAEKIAFTGLQLAQQFNSELAVVSIVDQDEVPLSDPPSKRELDDMIEGNSNQFHLNLIKSVFKDFPIKSFVEKGIPYKLILKTAEAWGADILVMGTHGRKGLSSILLGSVAEDVIRHSKKTIVVIPVS